MLLVIDNYDSFTWNLVQYLGELGQEPVVIRNDSYSVDEIAAMKPRRIVISPGPCTPSEAGVCVELIRRLDAEVPLLGVCLGHQSIGEAFGGKTVPAEQVMHGKTAAILHTGEGLFEGLPSPLTVTRYHSLVTAPEALPRELEAVAWSLGEAAPPLDFAHDATGRHASVGGSAPTDERPARQEVRRGEEIQALRHRGRPVWGVQFHPESLFSEGGREILASFLRM